MKIKIFVLFTLLLLLSCSPSKNTANKMSYVVTSPEVAEIIALLDGTDNIIGVTDQCDFPEELKNKEKVGGFGNVDIEKILSLNPKIVFTSALEQSSFAGKLEKLDMKTEVIYPRSIDELYESIVKIGQIINKQERAQFVVDSMKKEINLMAINVEDSVSVFMEIYGDPIMSVSNNSFVGELIKIAGGKNIFPVLPRDYSMVKVEEIIEKNPDIIITTYDGINASQISDRMGWEKIDACVNKRIYTVDDVNPDLILRAGPRIIEGIRKLRKIFYEKK